MAINLLFKSELKGDGKYINGQLQKKKKKRKKNLARLDIRTTSLEGH